MNRLLSILSIILVSFSSFSNCFGKFGLVKTMHSVNGGITIGTGKLAKLIRSILMIIPFSIAYGVATFLDLILFNLVEFWTDTNPIAKADYNMDGILVKDIEHKGQSIRLTYSDWGKELRMDSVSKSGQVSLYAYANQPGKLFQVKDGKKIDVSEIEGPVQSFAGY